MRLFDAALWNESSAIENEGEGESRRKDETEPDILPVLRGLLLLSIARRPYPLHLIEIMLSLCYPEVNSVADPSTSPSPFAIVM